MFPKELRNKEEYSGHEQTQSGRDTSFGGSSEFI